MNYTIKDEEFGMRRIHNLKCLQYQFLLMSSGKKQFHILEAGRDYAAGDILIFNEWDGGFTGRVLLRIIEHIEHSDHPGIHFGFCVVGIRPIILKENVIT